jgi:hypothetical protein
MGLAFACQLDVLNGLGTMGDAGKLVPKRVKILEMGVGRAAISKEKQKFVKLLDLPKDANPHGKSAAACEKYREDKLNNHWRKKAGTKVFAQLAQSVECKKQTKIEQGKDEV